jgi:hypothetical protein
MLARMLVINCTLKEFVTAIGIPCLRRRVGAQAWGQGLTLPGGEHNVEQFAAVIDYQCASRCFAASGKSGKGLVILDSCTRQA